jgi:L-rhamnose mutarotase
MSVKFNRKGNTLNRSTRLLFLLSLINTAVFLTGAGCRAPETKPNTNIRRFGAVIKIKPDKLDYYKNLHANPWPQVVAKIKECHIRNYSIYLKDEYLFSYFEYVGTDFSADMKKMAADSTTRAWWKETDPCQIPLESRKPGEWWAAMDEIFHTE